MTKSELFKRAHIIARMTVKAAGSYQIAFSCALKAVYAGAYSKFEAMLDDMRSILTATGANWYLCNNLRDHVVYFNACAKALGYDKADVIKDAAIRIGDRPSPALCRFVIWAYANKATCRDIANAMSARKASRRESFDVEDILSLGGGEAVYARITG
jgi:hypothetical protein